MTFARIALGLGVAVSMLGGAGLVSAADVKDKVTVQIESIGVQPGMPPGMYVCARGHLHVKALVQNQAGVDVGQVKVAGRAFDVDQQLLGTATASTRQAVLRPNETARVDIEFLTVTGSLIPSVTKPELTVTEARSKK